MRCAKKCSKYEKQHNLPMPYLKVWGDIYTCSIYCVSGGAVDESGERQKLRLEASTSMGKCPKLSTKVVTSTTGN